MSGMTVKIADSALDPAEIFADRVAACGTVANGAIGGSLQRRAICDGCSVEFAQLGKPEFAGADLCVDCVRLGRILQAVFLEERQRAEALCENPRAEAVRAQVSVARRKVRGLNLVAHDQMEEDDSECGVEMHVPTAVTTFLSRERWWLMALGFAVVFVATVFL